MYYITVGYEQRAIAPIEKIGEESPDCTEQKVPLNGRIRRTICRRKESATEKIPPDPSGKGEKVR